VQMLLFFHLIQSQINFILILQMIMR